MSNITQYDVARVRTEPGFQNTFAKTSATKGESTQIPKSISRRRELFR